MFSWFSRRSDPGSREAVLGSGPHRSPGLDLVVRELQGRRLSGVLDLGPPSNENLTFLSTLTERVSVQDLYRSCSQDGGAVGFRFRDVDAFPLPDERESFDLVLLWDLLHYIDPAVRSRFSARLAGLCRPGAIVLLHAADNAPVPPAPIQFKILGADTLLYQVPEGVRLPPPRLSTRLVEKALPGFRPLRTIQLRHGLQEAVYQRTTASSNSLVWQCYVVSA